MEKRVILALGLSLLVLIAFQLMMAKFYSKYSKGTVPFSVGAGTVPKQTEKRTVPKQLKQDEEEIVLQNNLYTLTFSNVGAGIKKITLNKNPKAGLTISYDVFSAKEPADSFFIFFPDNTGVDLNNVKYEVIKKTEDSLVFSHNFNNEFLLEKRWRLNNSLYRIELELIWRNLKGTELTKRYSLISGVHFPSSRVNERMFEIDASLDGKVLRNKKAGRPYEIQKNGNLNWLMLKDRYSAVILRSFSASFGYIVKQSESGKLIGAVNIPEFNIPANSTVSQKYGLYIGPLNFELAREADIGVESALTYGFLGSIGQLLMSVLRFFYKVSKNWGVAILLLAVFINFVLFPLTRKSYKSMQELQILQPKIERLRQEYKGNPQKLQKEIMELYKKYKINPMGGCLPLILQMPIFFALYQALNSFIELRGAKFLWVRDLSLPENIKLPFALPLFGNSINILPILMLAIMFVQQRLSTKLTAISQTDEQRQQQKFMMVFMAIMFGFIFYNLASGFVLYWLCSTVIMTLVQFILTKKPKAVSKVYG